MKLLKTNHKLIKGTPKHTGGCFTNVSQALQSNLAKICNAIIYISGENFKLKICMCDQSIALGTIELSSLKFHRRTISATHKFRDNTFESSWHVSETIPAHRIWKKNR